MYFGHIKLEMFGENGEFGLVFSQIMSHKTSEHLTVIGSRTPLSAKPRPPPKKKKPLQYSI